MAASHVPILVSRNLDDPQPRRCAIAPEPCTAEWLDWMAARLTDDIAWDHRWAIGHLRDPAALLLGPATGLQQPASALGILLTAEGVLQLMGDLGQHAWSWITNVLSNVVQRRRPAGFSPTCCVARAWMGVQCAQLRKEAADGLGSRTALDAAP